MKHIIIEGFFGSGKGVIAKKISKEMNIQVVEINKKISERMKMSTADIFDKYGETYYHALETFELSKLTRLRKRHIIVVGSNLPELPQNGKYLRELGRVYYLKRSAGSIVERLKEKPEYEDKDTSALKAKIEKNIKEKEVFYIDVADKIIDVDNESTSNIISIILNDIVKFDGREALAEQ